jgi:hypothetical protein
MPFRRVFAAFLLFGSTGLAADQLTTLEGQVIDGELVSITDKEIVMLDKAGQRVATPVPQVTALVLAPAAKLPPDARYVKVELVDSTVLHCADVAVKGKDIELTLLAAGGQPRPKVKVPLEIVGYVLRDAHDAAVQKKWLEWREEERKKPRSTDALIIPTLDGKGLQKLDGTIGEADDKGERLKFTLAQTGTPVENGVLLERIRGMIFLRPGQLAAASICKVHDKHGNVIFASKINQTERGFAVTSSAGATFDYGRDQLTVFDYSQGKILYLSDEDLWTSNKVKVVQTNTFDFLEPPRRDKNLEGREDIRLEGKIYKRGLALHSHTEVEFDLGGEYREFKAVVGMDDKVTGDGPTLLKIEGDGKQLFSLLVGRKDKPKELTLNIKDVQKLKIIVTTNDLLDTGKHLDLADAKVKK